MQDASLMPRVAYGGWPSGSIPQRSQYLSAGYLAQPTLSPPISLTIAKH